MAEANRPLSKVSELFIIYFQLCLEIDSVIFSPSYLGSIQISPIGVASPKWQHGPISPHKDQQLDIYPRTKSALGELWSPINEF